MAGVTHVGVAHDDGRPLVGLRVGEHVVAELAQLTQHRLDVGIALGVAVAAVGVHVGDIHVDDNVVCRIHGHHIVAETLLDAGVRAIVQIALRIVVLHVGLSGRAGCTGLPEEIQSVGVCGGAKGLTYANASAIGAVRILGETINKLRVILKVLTGGNDVPAEIVGYACHRCSSA